MSRFSSSLSSCNTCCYCCLWLCLSWCGCFGCGHICLEVEKCIRCCYCYYCDLLLLLLLFLLFCDCCHVLAMGNQAFHVQSTGSAWAKGSPACSTAAFKSSSSCTSAADVTCCSSCTDCYIAEHESKYVLTIECHLYYQGYWHQKVDGNRWRIKLIIYCMQLWSHRLFKVSLLYLYTWKFRGTECFSRCRV